MKKILIATLLSGMILLPTGCKKYTGEKAAAERSDWVVALNDSLKRIVEAKHADSIRLEQLHANVAEEIVKFTPVNNPREVEQYYILSAFKGSYPLTSTGIAARMMKNEQAELIVAHQGGAFTSILVKVAGESVESDNVPRDQGLNYTAGGLTTVAFTGTRSDSICAFITDHQPDRIELVFLNNGSQVGKSQLTDRQKEWVAGTWRLCGAHKEARLLERKLLIDSRKIEILKLTISREEQRASGTPEK